MVAVLVRRWVVGVGAAGGKPPAEDARGADEEQGGGVVD